MRSSSFYTGIFSVSGGWLLGHYDYELGTSVDSEGTIASRGIEDSAMSLKPQEDLGVPDGTRRVAIAAFPKGCACLRIGDVLGRVYQDKQLEALFPRRGQPAEAPGRFVVFFSPLDNP